MKTNICRSKLVDTPIVEMILSNKYTDSKVKFVNSNSKFDVNEYDLLTYSSGKLMPVFIHRNSSKYYNSYNFSISINKNKLSMYNNTLHIFIDEVANCLYLVNGNELLKYVLNKIDNVKSSIKKPNSYYMVIPKSDIRSMIGDNKDHIITYSNAIAKLFEAGRDESIYSDLI